MFVKKCIFYILQLKTQKEKKKCFGVKQYPSLELSYYVLFANFHPLSFLCTKLLNERVLSYILVLCLVLCLHLNKDLL